MVFFSTIIFGNKKILEIDYLPTSQVTPGPPLNGQRSILNFDEFLPIKPTCNKEWDKINLFVDQEADRPGSWPTFE